ncbi:YiiX/YebB-like N1pC/P60 family cysteine hydrolase [Halalkalibacterium halodurans]|uniref:YiiX/YebB-like N1pC/P60 family cysteine hydrolase n=1 Tax=Halalkalibacterium halodurans TaxID=86665 RepID=UPI002AA99117|nr:YiiX/YebB-like N1pC/P60 family cysteine hydrolase [Halalkalibacterium halodurans]MDY7221211.1 YiiX/YebB-like N1pC/P60 family cysteine hydrolase [Halalkalibacterium halodurans]MDY7240450.1 YiiX/YebB-like N1pC/P60 family cysteine hydrolase [Halalkalibacterium halodurans]
MKTLKAFLSLVVIGLFLVTDIANASFNVDELKVLDEFENIAKKADSLLDLEVDVEGIDQFNNEVSKLHIELENTLEKVQVDIYNTNEFNSVIDKLDQLDLKSQTLKEQTTLSVLSTSSKNWRYGDILYYSSGSKNAIGEKSFTGHTAVLSTTDYWVIEAARTKNNGSKVFHWNRRNLWEGASGIKQYKVTSKTGTNATAAERRAAVNYGLKQVGDPYALKTTIWSEDKWYCSKLTNAQWNHVGYNLQSSAAFTIDGIVAVIPSHIVADANTRLVKTWGTSLPGKV